VRREVVTLSNANPVEFAGRGPGFYDSNTDAEGGLKLVDMKRPVSVSSTVSVRCECGVKTVLVNGAESTTCPACGKTVEAKK
jgi:hypothetical protein